MTPAKKWPDHVIQRRHAWTRISPLNAFQWELHHPNDTPQKVNVLSHAFIPNPDRTLRLTLSVVEADGVHGVYAVYHQPDTTRPYVAVARRPDTTREVDGRHPWPSSRMNRETWVDVCPLNAASWWLRHPPAGGRAQALHEVRLLAAETIPQDRRDGVLVCAVITPRNAIHTALCSSVDNPAGRLFCEP